MRKRYSIVSIICLLTLSMSAWAMTSARLDELLSELKCGDEKRISHAAIRLAEYGPQAKDAVPALIEMIRHNELVLYTGPLLQYIASGFSVDEILHLTQDNNPIVQSCAMECFQQLNIDKETTLKIYTALLDDNKPFVAIAAVQELCKIGAGQLCLDVVIKLAMNEEPLIKAVAVSHIGDIGITAPQVKQVLQDNFSAPDKREAIKAAEIYQNLYPEEKQGIEMIRQLMKDEDRIVRWHAARAIGNLKEVDEQTLLLAEKAIQDADMSVVLNACYAMIRHQRQTEQAWRVINKSLKSDDFTELLMALMVLKQLGPAARQYQEQLMNMIRSDDQDGQLVAIVVLGEIQSSK